MGTLKLFLIHAYREFDVHCLCELQLCFEIASPQEAVCAVFLEEVTRMLDSHCLMRGLIITVLHLVKLFFTPAVLFREQQHPFSMQILCNIIGKL